MDDIIAETAHETGLDPATARQGLGILIAFLLHGGQQAKVRALVDRIPGAEQLAKESGGTATGLIGVFSELSAAGLGMGEMQALVRAFERAARERVGAADVDAVIAGIPGLSQFV